MSTFRYEANFRLETQRLIAHKKRGGLEYLNFRGDTILFQLIRRRGHALWAIQAIDTSRTLTCPSSLQIPNLTSWRTQTRVYHDQMNQDAPKVFDSQIKAIIFYES